MKEEVKGMKVVPAGMVMGEHVNGCAVECVNMRVDTDKVLRVVGAPTILAEGNYTPLVVMDTDRVIACNGTTLVEVKDGAVSEIGELPAQARCATQMEDVVTIMTEVGPYRLDRDKETGNLTVGGLKPKFPEIALRVKTIADYQVKVDARKLSKVYTNDDSELSATDLQTVTADMIAAYEALDEEIKNDGYLMQPVMARYKLKDRNGNVLMTSAPVLLGTENGLQCSEAINITSSDYQTIDQYVLSATAYKIEAEQEETIASTWDKIVDSVEVEVSSQFHAIDTAKKATCKLQWRGTNQTFIVAHLPGSVAMEAMKAEQNIGALIERMDMIKTATTTIKTAKIKVGESKTVQVGNMSAAEEMTLMKKALSAENDSDSRAIELSAPHSFTAATVSSNGVTTVWGRTKQLRWDGYSIKTFQNAQSGDAEGKWKAAVIVKTDAGEQLVRETTGTGKYTTTLGALLSYPSADAVTMTVMMSAEGKTFKKTVDLEMSRDGNQAYYLNSGLKPIELLEVDEDYLVPSSIKIEQQERATEVAVTRADDINQVKVATAVTTGTIEAITPLSHTISSWDAVRSRYHVFSHAGTYAIAVNQGMTKVTSQLLDERAITYGATVTSTGRGTMAISGTELLTINNSRVTSEVVGVTAVTAGWSGERQELWMVDADGAVTIANFSDSKQTRYYHRSESGITAMLSNGGDLYACDGQSLMKLSQERDSQPTIKWGGDIRLTIGAKKPLRTVIPRVSAVSVGMSSSAFDGAIAIDEDTITVKGAVKSDISADIYNRPRTTTRIEIEGTATSGTEIKDISIWTSRKL